MKTYVFIARRICEIGGAEQYLFNKIRHLESRGWRVFVFSARKGTILINGLKRFRNDVLPTLAYAPECFTKREVNKTIEIITARVGEFKPDPCIVESDSVNRAIWGELLALRLGAKHISFILQEEHGYDRDVRDFLFFKYKRHELAGITPKSINQILSDDMIKRREDTSIAAYCNNVVEDCEDIISPRLEKARYTFGSIGRLEKTCVPVIIQGFVQYFKTHPLERYNLVLIGGSKSEKTYIKIKNEIDKCPNVNLIISGNMYPIPRSLLDKIDVFVSTAGSAAVSYRTHCPTIRVHPVTGESQGIIGLDFLLTEKTMYDIEKGHTIPDDIEKALCNKKMIEYTINWDNYSQTMEKEFDRQICIADITPAGEYYNEKALMMIKTVHIQSHFAHWLSGHLFGGDGHETIRKLLKRK